MRRVVPLLLLISFVYSSGIGGSYYVPLYWHSFCGAANGTTLTSSLWTAQYGADGSITAIMGPLYIDYPVIYSRSPPDNYISLSGNETLQCYGNDANWLGNLSFYSNYSGAWTLVNSTNLTGQVDGGNTTVNFTSDYYWYCEICDVFGYCSQSPPWLIIYNGSIPNVTLILPPNETYTVNTTINFSCRAEDPNLDSVKLYVWRDGSLYYTTSTVASGTNYTANFTVSLGIGNYTWNCEANNSNGRSAFAPSNYTLHIVPVIQPVILNAWARPPVIINGSTEWLYISAMFADELYANVTLPNGTIVNVTLTNNANTSFTNTNLTGTYHVTFIARNSTSGNYSLAYDNFVAAEPIDFNLTVVDSSFNGTPSTLRIVYDEWTYVNTTSSNGHFLITLPNYTYNVTIIAASNNSRTFFENLSLSTENNKIFGVDRTQPAIDEVLYGFNSTFTSPTHILLYLSYSPLTTPLSFEKCSPFDFSAMDCSSGTSIGGGISGGSVVFSLPSLSEEGYKIIHEVIIDNDHDKYLDVEVITTGCVEDGVRFIVRDRSSEKPVEDARIYVKYGSTWIEVAYGSDVFFDLPYSGSYSYSVTAHHYHAVMDGFDVEVCHGCSSNDDCAENEYCNGGTCTPIECDCGVIVDHQCNAFECCSNDDCPSGLCYDHFCADCNDNSDCASDEVCSNHDCVPLDCGCGYAVDHTCYAYQCCEDADCGANAYCENHLCNPYDIQIDGPPFADEGDNVTIHVTINGEDLSNGEIYINGEEYTTDENGYVVYTATDEDIKVVYSGILKKVRVIPVFRELSLKLKLEGSKPFKGEPLHIIPVNSKGQPVRADITVRGPDDQVFIYRDVSDLEFTPYIGGKYVVTAEASKYLPVSMNFKANSCELKIFDYTLDYGKWTLFITLCWYWWVLFVILAIMLLLIWRKLSKNRSPDDLAVADEQDHAGEHGSYGKKSKKHKHTKKHKRKYGKKPKHRKVRRRRK